MKIIFSSNSSWSVYNFRKNLLAELNDQGHEVTVVAPSGPYLKKLGDMGFKTSPIKLDSGSTGIFDNLQLLLSLYKKYKLLKPDIVLHNAVKPNIYGAIICRWLKIPVINNISGLGTIFLSDNFTSKIGKLLYRFSQKKVKIIFFQNPTDLLLFKKKNLVRTNQAFLLPGSGVDLNRFVPVRNERDDNIIRFCYVGRLLKDKGIYELIDAIRVIKSKNLNCEFYIMGELYEQNPTAIKKKQLDTWIDEKLIIFLGKTDNVENELFKFDCIVLPSYREGLSRVLLEASAMAIPCITTNVPGCIDVIEHQKNGLICEVKNSEDLALQIERFTNFSKEKRNEMGAYGRKKVVAEFDEKIVIEKYIEAIRNITIK